MKYDCTYCGTAKEKDWLRKIRRETENNAGIFDDAYATIAVYAAAVAQELLFAAGKCFNDTADMKSAAPDRSPADRI